MLDKPKEVIKKVSDRMEQLKDNLRGLFDAISSGVKEIGELINNLGLTYSNLEEEHDKKIKAGATTALQLKEFQGMLNENINSTFRHFEDAFGHIARKISETVVTGLDDTTDLLEVGEELE